MTYFSRTRRTAAEALRLRGWALRRLLTGAEEELPAASALAWRAFLRSERCALLLQESLGESTSKLPSDCARELRDTAMRETVWILSARAQLHTIADIAAAHDIRVVALKGTAAVARGRNVQVTDVDVLATPADASKLARLLDATGFTRGPRDGPWHLAERMLSGAVNVEVHVAVSGFDSPETVRWHDVRAIDGMEPLEVLAPHDHAWTVLCQATRKHPDRRTRLRDLYLVNRALSESTVDERAALEARVLEDTYRRELSDMLVRATNVDQVEPATQRTLRRLYLLRARDLGVGSGTKTGRLWQMAVEVVAAGAVQDWERKQQLRDGSGVPRWTVRRFLFGAPLALIATVIGRVVSYDAFLLERRT